MKILKYDKLYLFILLLVLLVIVASAVAICFFSKIEITKKANLLVSVNDNNELEILSQDVEFFKPKREIVFYIGDHLYRAIVTEVKPSNEHGKALVYLEGFANKPFPGMIINVKVIIDFKTPWEMFLTTISKHF